MKLEKKKINNKQKMGYEAGDCQSWVMHTWEFITLFHLGMYFKFARAKIKQNRNFPGGPVVKNPPGNIGDTGSISDLGRFHMPQNN